VKRIVLFQVRGCLWIDKICDPSVSVLMVNVSQSIEQLAKVPKCDCWIVLHIVQELLSQGVKAESIGVVTVYTQNNGIMKTILDPKRVEVVAIERCENLIKDCIIVSCIKPNGKAYINRDFNKINIAFTRAKCKLVIIGSKGVLGEMESMKDYVEAVKALGVIVNSIRLEDERSYCEKNYKTEEFKLIQ